MDFVRELLESQHDASFRGPNGNYASVLEALDTIDAQAAAWVPAPRRHSIWQLVSHLTHAKLWLHQVLTTGNTASRDLWQSASGDEAAWAEARSRLLEAHEQLRDALRRVSDAQLQARPVTDVERTNADLFISAGPAHDAFHAGQIRTLRGLYESRRSRTAEDALDSIFAGGAEQCEMVAAAVRNPDVEVSWVQRMGFEYLVRVIRVEAEHSDLPSAARFARAGTLFERLTRDAALVAFDLARAWRCASCGDDVPGRLFISNVREKSPRLRVECATCGALSDLGEPGEARMRELYRENLATGWNPSFNNFQWDGT